MCNVDMMVALWGGRDAQDGAKAWRREERGGRREVIAPAFFLVLSERQWT